MAGCSSEENTEAIENIKEAIELYMEPFENDFTVSPETEILEIAVL